MWWSRPDELQSCRNAGPRALEHCTLLALLLGWRLVHDGRATPLRLAVGAARLEQIAVECFQKASRAPPPWSGAQEWRRGVSNTAASPAWRFAPPPSPRPPRRRPL